MPDAAAAIIEPMIEMNVVPNTNTITTITTIVTATAMPPNARRNPPLLAQLPRERATAARSTGSVSGRGSKETDAVGRRALTG